MKFTLFIFLIFMGLSACSVLNNNAIGTYQIKKHPINIENMDVSMYIVNDTLGNIIINDTIKNISNIQTFVYKRYNKYIFKIEKVCTFRNNKFLLKKNDTLLFNSYNKTFYIPIHINKDHNIVGFVLKKQ